ncbi:MAG: arginine repressor [Melioribacteraceae bacterium]|nr:arginine repressor [Melioribacteraceae bacterium]
MSNKILEIQSRHTLIKELVSKQEISNQAQFQKLLKQNGIKVTQATLSRDLNELGIIRVPAPNGFFYKINTSGEQSVLRSRLSEEIISIDHNETLIVIRTFPGRAQGVAIVLDQSNSTEILGTVAGDDTIIVIPRSNKNIKNSLEYIKIILGIN